VREKKKKKMYTLIICIHRSKTRLEQNRKGKKEEKEIDR
jgi:hypothetical protein